MMRFISERTADRLVLRAMVSQPRGTVSTRKGLLSRGTGCEPESSFGGRRSPAHGADRGGSADPGAGGADPKWLCRVRRPDDLLRGADRGRSEISGRLVGGAGPRCHAGPVGLPWPSYGPP